MAYFTKCIEIEIEDELVIEAAIDVCERWLKHIERQKQKTMLMQKAASLARKGNVEEARKIKNQIDSAPTAFDGANFIDVMPTILNCLQHSLAALDEGMKLLPVEPTEEMILAGINYRLVPNNDDSCKYIYKAMIEAAPPSDEHLKKLGECCMEENSNE